MTGCFARTGGWPGRSRAATGTRPRPGSGSTSARCSCSCRPRARRALAGDRRRTPRWRKEKINDKTNYSERTGATPTSSLAERCAMTFDGFDLPDELRMMRDVASKFVAERLRVVEREIGPEATGIPDDRLAGLRAEARAAGLWCLDAPAEYGGGGLSAFQLVVVLEEACKHRFCFPHAGGGAFGHSPPVVLYQGDADLIDRYVKPTIEQGWTSYTAIAEESGGSDPARAIRTTAR